MPKRQNARALVSTLGSALRPVFLLGGQRYALRNFSEIGMGVWMPRPPEEAFTVGSVIDAAVELGGVVYPLRGEVRHFDNGVLGLKAIDVSAELKQRFAELAAPARRAATLRLEPAVAGEETGDGRLKYSDGQGTELELRYNRMQRMILKVRISWEGRWVFRELQGAPVTGFGTTPDLAPNPVTLSEAGSLLAAVPSPLPGHLLWQFLETGEQVYLPESALPAKRAA